MDRLRSSVDPSSDSFRRNASRMEALVAELAGPAGAGAGRRRRRGASPAPRAGQTHRQGTAGPPAGSGVAVPGTVAARRLGRVRRRRTRGRARHRRRTCVGTRGPDRRQRRDRQGRHLLSAHGEEAPACAGRGPREPPALRLPRRFGRRLPAAAGRGVSRPRPLRPHLLQPGAHVGRRHRAGRRRDGLLHGRWRVRAGDVGRDDHRQRHGHDLSRRPAAREGGHRRGRHR